MSFDQKRQAILAQVERPVSITLLVVAALLFLGGYLTGARHGASRNQARNDAALAALTLKYRQAQATVDAHLRNAQARDSAVGRPAAAIVEAIKPRAEAARATIRGGAAKLPPGPGEAVLRALAVLDSQNTAQATLIEVLKADTADYRAAFRTEKALAGEAVKADSVATERANDAEARLAEAKKRGLWLLFGGIAAGATAALVTVLVAR